jgi:hypothetical protein
VCPAQDCEGFGLGVASQVFFRQRQVNGRVAGYGVRCSSKGLDSLCGLPGRFLGLGQRQPGLRLVGGLLGRQPKVFESGLGLSEGSEGFTDNGLSQPILWVRLQDCLAGFDGLVRVPGADRTGRQST